VLRRHRPGWGPILGGPAADTLIAVLSFGPAKILILLAVALIVLGPEKLPQMSRQIGKAWGDFRRFREHLEGEVRGALGEDIVQQFRSPWQPDGSSVSSEAYPPDGSTPGEGAQDRAPPREPRQLAPLPPAAGSSTPGTYRGWDPGLAPDDPSLN
jgi:TatA/E family protein of Tat protein translocase